MPTRLFDYETERKRYFRLISFAIELQSVADYGRLTDMDLKNKLESLIARGWKQAEIAKAAGIGQGTVSKILADKSGAHLSTYRKIMALKGRKK